MLWFTLIILFKVNPVEYGHIFLVPYNISQRPKFLDKKMLCLISQFAKEIDTFSFRVFYDHSASAYMDHVHFQVKSCRLYYSSYSIHVYFTI